MKCRNPATARNRAPGPWKNYMDNFERERDEFLKKHDIDFEVLGTEFKADIFKSHYEGLFSGLIEECVRDCEIVEKPGHKDKVKLYLKRSLHSSELERFAWHFIFMLDMYHVQNWEPLGFTPDVKEGSVHGFYISRRNHYINYIRVNDDPVEGPNLTVEHLDTEVADNYYTIMARTIPDFEEKVKVQ